MCDGGGGGEVGEARCGVIDSNCSSWEVEA